MTRSAGLLLILALAGCETVSSSRVAVPEGPVVVARVQQGRIEPALSQAALRTLVRADYERAAHRAGKGVRVEATRFERHGDHYSFVVDAQLSDDNDLLMSFPLTPVRYGQMVLLVLNHRRT